MCGAYGPMSQTESGAVTLSVAVGWQKCPTRCYTCKLIEEDLEKLEEAEVKATKKKAKP